MWGAPGNIEGAELVRGFFNMVVANEAALSATNGTRTL
jgi:hypothetical protein